MTDPKNRNYQTGTELVAMPLPDPTAIASMDEDGKVAALEACEAVIKRSAYWMGLALSYIKEHELWRQSKHTSWQAYLADRWQLDRTYAHRHIQMAETIKRLDANLEARGALPDGNTVATIVRNEAQARDLRGNEDDVLLRVDEGEPPEQAIPEVIRKARIDKADQQQATREVPIRVASPVDTGTPSTTPPSAPAGAPRPPQTANGQDDEAPAPTWRDYLESGVLGSGVIVAPEDQAKDLLAELFTVLEQMALSKARAVLAPYEDDLCRLLGIEYEEEA